jgi:Zn-dependent peptidase ImmA (M78 family)/DNA-binding XRE family transcriptional regulator
MISGERVRQARELKGMTQTKLASLIGVSQAAIAQIESGAFVASDDLITAIANRTSQPVQFFHQPPAPEFDVGSLLFRSHASMTKRELSEAYRYAQVMYDIAVRMQQQLRAMPVKIPKLTGSPAAAARDVRKALRVPLDQPAPHLLNVLEWNGAMVIVIPNVPSRDAFSLWHNETPILAVSADRPGDRSRMSVAHELAHLVLHAGKNRLGVDEGEADEFAAEFLMPEAVMRKSIQTPVTLSSLAEIKSIWRVSIQALVRRAKDLDIITDRQYRYLFEQLSSLGWRTSEPVSIETEKPRAIRQMAEMLYGNPIDYRAMANDMAVTPEFIREAMSQYAQRVDKSPAVGLNAKVVRLPSLRRA